MERTQRDIVFTTKHEERSASAGMCLSVKNSVVWSRKSEEQETSICMKLDLSSKVDITAEPVPVDQAPAEQVPVELAPAEPVRVKEAPAEPEAVERTVQRSE